MSTRDKAARAARLARAMTRPELPEALRNAPTGVWLGASLVHGKTAPVADLYPHICQFKIGRAKLDPRDCPACLRDQAGKRKRKPAAAPEIPDDARAVAARMLGEREDDE